MRSGVISSIFNLQPSSTEPRSIFEISSDFYNCKQPYVADDSVTSSHLSLSAPPPLVPRTLRNTLPTHRLPNLHFEVGLPYLVDRSS